MTLPLTASNVLKFLGYTGFTLHLEGGVPVVEEWTTGIEPAEQEVIDAANDLTTINGQVFSVWFAENGGDATKTNRKQAIDSIDVQTSQEGSKRDVILRATLLVVLDEFNILRAKYRLPARTASQLRNAIKGKISSGGADA